MKGAPGDALGSLEEGTCPCGQPAVVPSSEEGQGQPEDVRVVLEWEPGCRGAGRPPPRSPHTPHTHPLTTHPLTTHTHTRRHTHLPDSIKRDSNIVSLSRSALSGGKSKMAQT